ncbi:Glycine--tRNA ligase 1, mitochondrial [Fulvia fulva]|nr:Glycine--tRNA ligase 1, mitochondrial [Fulvia fulva]KAK4622587.1 Glycine--tRNA ligase 1, mitochondrial [Fulvia fulva]WPV16024.1 Glycine--tRNA ligase 1, mitochondrial [Fulvia fulva]WPV30916.1 Glycine--tRNA ligase 1, mitochondrial [Fulvia fulva]
MLSSTTIRVTSLQNIRLARNSFLTSTSAFTTSGAKTSSPEWIRSFSQTASSQKFQVPIRTRNSRNTTMADDYKTRAGQTFNRDAFESLIKRKQFYWQSFEPYGGTKGLFDYGPPLAAIEAEFTNIWRDHFVRSEKMMELKCSMLTPYPVFKASGHVERFNDFMCKDTKTGDILRADHLIKDVLEARLKGDKEARGEKVSDAPEDPKKKKKASKVKNEAVKLDDAVVQQYNDILATLDDTVAQWGQMIKEHKMVNPVTGNEVTDPVEVNLMFPTQLGMSGKEQAYLRPETAQGQFLSFPKLVEYSDGQLPFASASIGYSFRNELSPRNGLLRVREFLMAEVEHFVDAEGGKKHPKFASVKDVELPLLDRDTQSGNEAKGISPSTTPQTMTIGKAVETKLVDNETLGYFLVRIYRFMERIGVDTKKLRFRQHMANEMAHYASDCWDCELQGSYGWVECVGCADRSAYDLSVHEKATGVPLRIREPLKELQHIEEYVAQLDKKESGPKLRKNVGAVQAALDDLTQDIKEKLSISLQEQGKVEVEVPNLGKIQLGKELVKIEKEKRTVTMREFVPNVIEPSFGIGRILYHLLEHAFWVREGKDEARSVMSFKPTVAPMKVLVVPLQKDQKFASLIQQLEDRLDEEGLSYKVDQSGVSIGKRYSRNDELGIPFGITIDYESLEGKTAGTFTLRDRDSTKQVRASLDEIVEAIAKVVKGKWSWSDVQQRLPAYEGKEEEKE